jgi:hypothetical protein
MRVKCIKCGKEYRKKDFQRHSRSSYHLTFTDDKIEKQIDHEKDWRKKYYEKNKEKYLDKHDCECGGKCLWGLKARHLKTEKHKNFILSNNINAEKITETEEIISL